MSLCQKAPSAKRCIKTCTCLPGLHLRRICQKAPSAKRCIKTRGQSGCHLQAQGGQKAPSAKRCIKTLATQGRNDYTLQVRKHRAPKGALRRPWLRASCSTRPGGQKAPSAKRCIKTLYPRAPQVQAYPSQKAPSAKRCIKTCGDASLVFDVFLRSESTERQKVH